MKEIEVLHDPFLLFNCYICCDCSVDKTATATTAFYAQNDLLSNI